MTVTLSSSDTSEATVPATVTIPANQASATFAITAVDDSLLDGTQTTVIGVAAGGYVGSGQSLDVTDYETLSVTINTGSISENGGTAIGTVLRGNTDRSQALTVTLSSSDTSEARSRPRSRSRPTRLRRPSPSRQWMIICLRVTWTSRYLPVRQAMRVTPLQ